jgi:glycosyltransferase involved in cell wall biosynthesis
MGNSVFDLKLKGVDRLIDIYRNFENIKKTTICMTKNKNLTSWMMNSIKNHFLFVNIKKDKIVGIIKKLRGGILIIPSRYEGFSLSLIEGMSQGLVPVIYSVGVAPEIIRNGENGFIISSQEEAISKIDLLLSNYKLRNKCSIEAEKTAKLFSSDKIASKLIRLYKNVCAQNQ